MVIKNVSKNRHGLKIVHKMSNSSQAKQDKGKLVSEDTYNSKPKQKRQ